MKAIFKTASVAIRTSLRLFLVISLSANILLGVVNFVLQPVWRAAAVTTAVAATKAQAKVSEKQAVSKAKAKEKAKARLRRVVVAVPIAGVGAAGYFEYADYQEWQQNNPDKEPRDYAEEIYAITEQVSQEVLDDLPERYRPSREMLTRSRRPIVRTAVNGNFVRSADIWFNLLNFRSPYELPWKPSSIDWSSA